MATPSWTDFNVVKSLAKIAVGATSRVTFNLGDYFVGRLFVQAMRLSSSTPSAGLTVLVRDLLTGTPTGGSGTVAITHPSTIRQYLDNTTASNLTTLNGSPTIPGQTVTLTSATGFAANQPVGIVDSTTTPTVIEFGRTSKISSTTLTMDVNLTNTSLATGFTITNGAFLIPPILIDGTAGSGDIELVFDNGAETTVSYAVQAWGQVLTSIG